MSHQEEEEEVNNPTVDEEAWEVGGEVVRAIPPHQSTGEGAEVVEVEVEEGEGEEEGEEV